jgi:hypothetical protein
LVKDSFFNILFLILFIKNKIKFFSYNYFLIKIQIKIIIKNYGDWGLGIGDWGLGIGPNPQSPIPKSPIPNPHNF